GNCGERLAGMPCPHCGTLNPESLNYCDNCGTWLDKPAQKRSFYHDYPEPRKITAALAVLLILGAVLLLRIAGLSPGPYTMLMSIIGAFLGGVGLALGRVWYSAYRDSHSNSR